MAQSASRPHGRRRSASSNKLKAFSARAGMDLPFLMLVLSLLSIGLIMLFSSSYAYALANQGDSFHYVTRQMKWACLGIAVMLVVSYFDYHKLKKFTLLLLVISYAMLIVVLILPTHGGAKRWIYFGSFSFQPSEITKFALILAYAHFMTKFYHNMQKFWKGFMPYMLLCGTTVVLLVKQPHLSCSMIILIITMIMLFTAGLQFRYFVIIFGAVAILLYMAIAMGLVSYAGARFEVWLDPFGYPDADASHQTRQSLYAIGSGGLLGLGLGNSRQKYLYLPEPQNDFIFAVICEELGFVGAVMIIALFGALVWRGIVIARRAQDKFGTMLAMGLTAQVGVQALLNIAVVSNSMPNTGISLPFFSYGGTSLVLLLAQMGLVLSVSRSAKMEKA